MAGSMCKVFLGVWSVAGFHAVVRPTPQRPQATRHRLENGNFAPNAMVSSQLSNPFAPADSMPQMFGPSLRVNSEMMNHSAPALSKHPIFAFPLRGQQEVAQDQSHTPLRKVVGDPWPGSHCAEIQAIQQRFHDELIFMNEDYYGENKGEMAAEAATDIVDAKETEDLDVVFLAIKDLRRPDEIAQFPWKSSYKDQIPVFFSGMEFKDFGFQADLRNRDAGTFLTSIVGQWLGTPDVNWLDSGPGHCNWLFESGPLYERIVKAWVKWVTLQKPPVILMYLQHFPHALDTEGSILTILFPAMIAELGKQFLEQKDIPKKWRPRIDILNQNIDINADHSCNTYGPLIHNQLLAQTNGGNMFDLACYDCGKTFDECEKNRFPTFKRWSMNFR